MFIYTIEYIFQKLEWIRIEARLLLSSEGVVVIVVVSQIDVGVNIDVSEVNLLLNIYQINNISPNKTCPNLVEKVSSNLEVLLVQSAEDALDLGLLLLSGQLTELLAEGKGQDLGNGVLDLGGLSAQRLGEVNQGYSQLVNGALKIENYLNFTTLDLNQFRLKKCALFS